MLYLTRTYLWCPWKVYHINPFLFEEIEPPLPIITHDKGIHMVFTHIIAFLLPTFFWNNKINVTYCLKKLFPLFITKVCFLVLFIPVKFIRR